MKHQFKITLSFFTILLFSNFIIAQDLYDTLSQELCECLETQKIKNALAMTPCIDKLFENNLRVIKEHYKVDELSETNIDELTIKIGMKIIKQCEYVFEHFPNGIIGSDKNVIKQADLNCENQLIGNYYYLTQRPDSSIQDTTFVTISNGTFLEKMNYRNSYSLLKIIWKDHCKFDLEFQESDDPFKKEMSKPGDIYNYEVIANEKNSVFLKLYWLSREYQLELIKQN